MARAHPPSCQPDISWRDLRLAGWLHRGELDLPSKNAGPGNNPAVDQLNPILPSFPRFWGTRRIVQTDTVIATTNTYHSYPCRVFPQLSGSGRFSLMVILGSGWCSLSTCRVKQEHSHFWTATTSDGRTLLRQVHQNWRCLATKGFHSVVMGKRTQSALSCGATLD